MGSMHSIQRYKLLAILFILSLINVACSNSDNNSTEMIEGTAAKGAPLIGTVSIIDANGNIETVSIESDGSYHVNVSGMSPPFLIKATDAASNTYFSFAAGTGVTNITPLTSLAVFMVVGKQDLDALFNNWVDHINDISQSALENAAKIIYANLSEKMAEHGITPEQFNIFTEAFPANGTGMDAVLDDIVVSLATLDFTLDVDGEALSFNEAVDVSDFFNMFNTTTGCPEPSYTDVAGFFDFLNKKAFVITSINGSGGNLETHFNGVDHIILEFNNGYLNFKECTAEDACTYQVGYGGNKNYLETDGFEMTETETNIYLLTEGNMKRSLFYEHATCKVTYEIRSALNLLDWAQLIYTQ